jgi:hypothetical protein
VAALIGAQSAPPRKDIPAIAKAANGAIVSIIMSNKDGHAVSQGSGFLISKDGRIVTNYHVIENGSSAIVKLPDGAFFAVDGVVASDKARDVAVIQANGQNFKTLILGNSDRVQVGEEVVAIGNPLSLESTVSNGIVSGIRTIEGKGGQFLQITTPISPGSSGGPLFNIAGEVVGITTLYLEGGENLNFAIPINDVKRLLLAGSTVHEFPNEPGTGKLADDVTFTPPSPVNQTSTRARAYFMQLYNAGGFAKEVAEENSAIKHYVCYNDDDSSGEFFVFEAGRFDQQYSDASVALVNLAKQYGDRGLTHGEAMHDPKVVQALQTMKKIQDGTPYVQFWMGDLATWNSLPHLQSPWFQFGSLSANIYKKGVRDGFEAWGWDQNSDSWMNYMSQTTNDNVAEQWTYRLSIEPSTMRYRKTATVIFSAGTGATKVSDSKSFEESGTCERISDPR